MHLTTPFNLTALLTALLTATTLFTPALAGPVAYAACQAGCAGLAMACYTAGSAVWGATAGLGAAPAIVGCNMAFGKCSATCAAVALLAPTP